MGYKKVLAAFYRGVLSARYRVRLEGAGLLAERRATLFLPNHQASVDPQIVCSQLLRYVDVSPLVTEGYFKIPVVAQVLHLMNAVRVPDLEKSRRGVEIVAGLNRVVVDALAAGHNVLLYPAGQLTRGLGRCATSCRRERVSWVCASGVCGGVCGQGPRRGARRISRGLI